MVRIAINGYGRIGRCFLRALHASPWRESLQVVAINEPADLDSMAYLTRFDSTHGVFPGEVTVQDGGLCIDGQAIRVFHADTPEGVAWGGLGIDLGADGVTVNDAGDTDSGPNNLTNFVDLLTATTTGTELRLTGSASVAANTYYVVQIYSSPAGDPSGYGEGLTYLGSVNVPVGASGTVSGSYTLSGAIAAGSIITSTATRSDSSYTTYYETSEFSNQVTALAPGVTVTPVSTTTTEAGGTASFTVVLNAAPNATVTIPVSSSDTTEGSVSASSAAPARDGIT